RARRSVLLAGGAALVGLGFGATCFFRTALPITGTVALWTLGEILFAAFHSPVTANLAPERFRGRYFGVTTASFSAATMIGPVLGGIMLERWGDAMWLACAAIGAAAALVIVSVRTGIDKAAQPCDTVQFRPEEDEGRAPLSATSKKLFFA